MTFLFCNWKKTQYTYRNEFSDATPYSEPKQQQKRHDHGEALPTKLNPQLLAPSRHDSERHNPHCGISRFLWPSECLPHELA
eukprot:2016728-Amphidinium_carterae.1